jgi:colanic acid biosynthesis glycosyl transferase WcaI
MTGRGDICFMCLNYPPEPTGIAPYTGGLAVGLHQLGYQVTVHVSHPHYPEWSIQQGYGQWAHFERIAGVVVKRRRHYVPRVPRGVRRLLSEISFGVRLLFAQLGSPSAAILVSPSLFATALAALRLRLTGFRSPLILWVQDIYTLGLAETGEGGGLAGRATRWVEARTLRSADKVVVIHQRFADYAVSELGVDASRVAVVRNWTHLARPAVDDSATAKLALGWPGDVKLAVHTGNMGVKQGLENIVDAARIADERASPVHFLLVGDGGQRASLMERARGISRLTFVNTLDDEQYRQALGAADVLLVNEKPGVAAMAAPSKLTSYFHAGRPVVAATDAEGITAMELAESGAGVVIPAGQPEALLEAVLALAEDPAEAARLGVKGRLYRNEVLGERAAIERWAALIDSASEEYRH